MTREPYGRLVHDIRLAHEADQAAAEGRARFHLGLWEDRSDAQHELDMRIGSAVAARGAADAQAEIVVLRAKLMAVAGYADRFRHALRIARSDARHRQCMREAQGYEDALAALGGGEDQERSDEKETP